MCSKPAVERGEAGSTIRVCGSTPGRRFSTSSTGAPLAQTGSLAHMQVEDHPVSYFDFEGTIPKGNYGGGTVMVWDAGTWEPLSPVPVKGEDVPGTEKEAVAMLAKGDLKFRLKGTRLNGDFALVQIKI